MARLVSQKMSFVSKMIELKNNTAVKFIESIRRYSFSTSTKFFKNQIFLPNEIHKYICLWGRKNCVLFKKFCQRTNWMRPTGG